MSTNEDEKGRSDHYAYLKGIRHDLVTQCFVALDQHLCELMNKNDLNINEISELMWYVFEKMLRVRECYMSEFVVQQGGPRAKPDQKTGIA